MSPTGKVPDPAEPAAGCLDLTKAHGMSETRLFALDAFSVEFRCAEFTKIMRLQQRVAAVRVPASRPQSSSRMSRPGVSTLECPTVDSVLDRMKEFDAGGRTK